MILWDRPRCSFHLPEGLARPEYLCAAGQCGEPVGILASRVVVARVSQKEPFCRIYPSSLSVCLEVGKATASALVAAVGNKLGARLQGL